MNALFQLESLACLHVYGRKQFTLVIPLHDEGQRQ